MKQGYVKLHRKSLDSLIFAHAGLWKLFCLCLMKANHLEIEVIIPGLLKPVLIKPGQFVTGRNSLWKDYHQMHLKRKPRRKPLPTGKTLFQWLLTLQSMSILCIKSYNKYSIITVLNWNRYQQNVQQTFNRRSTDVHKQEGIKNDKETPSLFFLQKRYPDQDLIKKIFQAIASTRKSGKVSDSVLLGQLQKWARYPVSQVEAGIKIYLEKDYAGQGKREEYLFGIIRRQNQSNTDQGPVYLDQKELFRDE